jgi:S-adenosylmethionine:tRNA ribosyltransferase-isomerase
VSVPALARPHTRFELPPELSAVGPPESRGVPRDGVRLLVASPASLRHARFRDLPDSLEPGDLLVVNTSATLPAAADAARPTGEAVVVHFSTRLDDRSWVVELRRLDGPARDATRGERLRLRGGAWLRLTAGFPDESPRAGSRLWRASFDGDGGVERYLARHGRPIRYGYVTGRWPLTAYQTVYASRPGSAEMPSAGRPFTTELITRLVARGVIVAPVILHTGVSSLEARESPYPEWYDVPPVTARLVESTRAVGSRIVAVGTTVVRALETVTGTDGHVEPGSGWTSLVLTPERPARVVTGLLTGLHDPAASHLLLLETVAGPDLVQRAYDAALRRRYLWHEFGDSCLLLP